MGFRVRPSYTLVGGFACFEDIDDVNEEGLTRRKRYNPHMDKLPPVEKFELETLLKAGVSLQQTRSKILAPSAVGVADAIAELEDSDFQQLKDENKK